MSATAVLPAPIAARPAASAGKYFTFALGQEEYGLPILKVREIMGYSDVTAVPRAPTYVKGVMNLRGQVIAVVDLRAKFGMEPARKTDQTCIIVVEVIRGGRIATMGIIVDRVNEVLDIAASAIEPSPTFGESVQTDFILGIGKIGRGVRILLDIDRVMRSEDVLELPELVAGPQTGNAANMQ